MTTTTPMTPDQLVTALRAEGLTVVEHPGWRENKRPGDWGPVHGAMFHHTAIATLEASLRVCFSGRQDLAGPLCTGVVDRNGTVHLVGSGRANHAGIGSSAVLAAAVNGLSVPAKPGPDNTSGNAHFYGWELVNTGDGKDPWSAAQVEAAVKIGTALARHHGWTGNRSIAHREWTARKVDPRGIDMGALRAAIDTRLKAKPAATAPAGPKWPGVYLREGSGGEHVKTWQRRLNTLRGARLTVDGKFGPKTEAATVAFQRAKKIGADGIVGPVTWRAAWS